MVPKLQRFITEPSSARQSSKALVTFCDSKYEALYSDPVWLKNTSSSIPLAYLIVVNPVVTKYTM